jgi:hypothetical protein
LTALFPKEAQAIAGGGRSCTAFVGVDQPQQEGFILRVDLEKGQVTKLSGIPVSTSFAVASPIALSADEKRLAVVFRKYTEAASPCDAIDSDICMVIFDTQSGAQIATHAPPGTTGGTPIDLGYIDEQRIALLVDAKVFMLDLRSGETSPWSRTSDIDEVFAIAYARSARRFTAAGKSEVRVLEFAN